MTRGVRTGFYMIRTARHRHGSPPITLGNGSNTQSRARFPDGTRLAAVFAASGGRNYFFAGQLLQTLFASYASATSPRRHVFFSLVMEIICT